MRLAYRLRQFFRALRPTIAPDDEALTRHVLSEDERRLFDRMARFDQRHALDVCWLLMSVGQNDAALLRAALLHDCGKVDDDGRPIPLLYYGLFVLLLRLAPAIYWTAAASGRGPLRPFRIHAEHQARSLRLASAAGTHPRTLAILAGYHTAPDGSPGAWLRWADDLC